MTGRLRIVEDPPDAPLDPLQEIIVARDALIPLTSNPLLPNYGHRAVEATIEHIESYIPTRLPRGRSR